MEFKQRRIGLIIFGILMCLVITVISSFIILEGEIIFGIAMGLIFISIGTGIASYNKTVILKKETSRILIKRSLFFWHKAETRHFSEFTGVSLFFHTGSDNSGGYYSIVLLGPKKLIIPHTFQTLIPKISFNYFEDEFTELAKEIAEYMGLSFQEES